MIKYYLHGVLVGVDDRRDRSELAATDAAMHSPNPECAFDMDAFFQGTDNLQLP